MKPPTDSQWEAIRTTERHLLVSAGAGTGKTSTVVGRILYLLGAESGAQTCAAPLALRDIARDHLHQRRRRRPQAQAAEGAPRRRPARRGL